MTRLFASRSAPWRRPRDPRIHLSRILPGIFLPTTQQGDTLPRGCERKKERENEDRRNCLSPSRDLPTLTVSLDRESGQQPSLLSAPPDKGGMRRDLYFSTGTPA